MSSGFSVQDVAHRTRCLRGYGTFAAFVAGKALTASQLEFINMLVEHLTARDIVDPRQLYESPFTDIDALWGFPAFLESMTSQRSLTSWLRFGVARSPEVDADGVFNDPF
jgi:hypothetical protein